MKNYGIMNDLLSAAEIFLAINVPCSCINDNNHQIPLANFMKTYPWVLNMEFRVGLVWKMSGLRTLGCKFHEHKSVGI